MEPNNATAAFATDLCQQKERDEENLHFSSMELPVFEKRPPKEKYQVRFWSTPAAYQQFVEEVEKHELVIQDVMNNLMHWFTQSSQAGAIKDRIIERRSCTAEQQG